MDNFNATLKAAFAEAHEPIDGAFVVNVGQKVARKEKRAEMQAWAQVIGLALGAMAAFSGVMILAMPLLQDLFSGLQTTYASASFAFSSLSMTAFVNSVSAVLMSQLVLSAAAIAGGVVLYRSNQRN